MNTLTSYSTRNLRQKVLGSNFADTFITHSHLGRIPKSEELILDIEKSNIFSSSLAELLEFAARDSRVWDTLMCSGQDPYEKLLSLLVDESSSENKSERGNGSPVHSRNISAQHTTFPSSQTSSLFESHMSDVYRTRREAISSSSQDYETARLNAAMKGLEGITIPTVGMRKEEHKQEERMRQLQMSLLGQPRAPFSQGRVQPMSPPRERSSMFLSSAAHNSDSAAVSMDFTLGGKYSDSISPFRATSPVHRSAAQRDVGESLDPVLELAMLLHEEQTQGRATAGGGAGGGGGVGSSSNAGYSEGSSLEPLHIVQALQSVIAAQGSSHVKGSKPNTSRYESQKGRDWVSFGHFLSKCEPPVAILDCTDAHVIDFLNYLDQYGKTKVHNPECAHFGSSGGSQQCECPLKQAWGSLDSLVGRLRAAFDKHNEQPSRENPFGSRRVRTHLLDIRDYQAKARGVLGDKKKRKSA